MIFLCKIVIFHTKYPKSAPPNLKILDLPLVCTCTYIYSDESVMAVQCHIISLRTYQGPLHFDKDLYSRKDKNLVFSRVARFYATTEQKLSHSF